MQVYKFGGASIATPQNMEALLPIINEAAQPLMVVVSAIGKTTNALEEVVQLACMGDTDAALQKIASIEQMHEQYASALLEGDNLHNLLEETSVFFTEMQWALDNATLQGYDYVYDQIVSIGELLSTTIFSHFLNNRSHPNVWIDVRDIVRTDSTYREGRVDEAFTTKQVKLVLAPAFAKTGIVVTQGFIGCTDENNTTTLGREGSDYSAALIASMLPATSVTIWKDVKGLLNADPRLFSDTQKIEQISFYEVIEMAYYGAQVIHPKTIKPLYNHNIPLFVKCFLDKDLKGTVIKNEVDETAYPPLIIVKKDQILLQITSKDYSFVTEDKLSEVYNIFHNCKVKINLLQNAAISLIVAVDNVSGKIESLNSALETDYKLVRNEGVELLTIRHYDEETYHKLTRDKTILLQQKSRNTVQLVLK